MLTRIHGIFSIVDKQYISHKLLSESDVVFEIAYQLRCVLSPSYLIRLNPYIKTGRKAYNFPDISVWRRGKCTLIIEVKEKSRISERQWKSEKSRMTTYEKRKWRNKTPGFKAYTYLISHRQPGFPIDNSNVHLAVVEEIIAKEQAFKKWLNKFKILSKQKKKRKV